jgi:uncharacterized iron-regulated protein
MRGKDLLRTIVAVQAQRTLSFDALVDAVTSVDVIALGEEHHQQEIQAFALRLLQDLAQHRPQRLALAMEFLERDQQPTVDAYLSGSIDHLTLQKRLGASEAFMRDYFPLLHYARQRALPVIAMNIPRRIARRVAQEGLEKTLQQLPPGDREYMPVVLSAITPSYRSYFLQAVAAHHPLAGEQVNYFVQAAHLKDETMAEALALFLDAHPGYSIVALAGRFHFDYGKAIPALLRQRRQHLDMSRITAMAVAEDSVMHLQQFAQDHIADYLWFAPSAPAAHRQSGRQFMTLLQSSWQERLEQHQQATEKGRNTP